MRCFRYPRHLKIMFSNVNELPTSLCFYSLLIRQFKVQWKYANSGERKQTEMEDKRLKWEDGLKSSCSAPSLAAQELRADFSVTYLWSCLQEDLRCFLFRSCRQDTAALKFSQRKTALISVFISIHDSLSLNSQWIYTELFSVVQTLQHISKLLSGTMPPRCSWLLVSVVILHHLETFSVSWWSLPTFQ